MPYNYVTGSFHTKKLCSRLVLEANAILHQNGSFALLRPLKGGLRAMYDDHLRLIGKHIVDFLLVFIEFFW